MTNIKKEIWTVGKHSSTVVSTKKVQNTNFPIPPNNRESGDDEIEYYGGYLICESVSNKKNSQLISAAPDMLEALQSLKNEDNKIPEYVWNKVQRAINKALGNEVCIKKST